MGVGTWAVPEEMEGGNWAERMMFRACGLMRGACRRVEWVIQEEKMDGGGGKRTMAPYDQCGRSDVAVDRLETATPSLPRTSAPP